MWWKEVVLSSYIWIFYDWSDDKIIEKSQKAISDWRKKPNRDWVYVYKFDPNEKERAHQNIEILSQLDKAMEEWRIEIVWQWIHDSRTWKLYKKEILLRIRTVDWRLDGPYKYLKRATDIWRLPLITDSVIRKTFSYISQNQDKQIWYSINISSDDLIDSNFSRILQWMSYEYGIDTNLITLEILEWEIDWENYIENIKKLRNMWFKIAMDDFWSDNSNLNRLIDLLWIIDYLKIDWKIIKSLFREDWEKNETIVSLLEWIVKACRISWVYTVAEFVEDEKIAKICNVIWIDYLQWYHYSKPEELK